MTELPDARITPTQISIGGTELPGLIGDDSVRVTPGWKNGINTVTVDFLVGHIVVEEAQ